METDELGRFGDKLGVPAVIGGVIEANGEVSLKVVGVRRRGGDVPVAASDRVHIGSCFKMITATLLGTFVEEGRADWLMPITNLFPDLKGSMNAAWHHRTVTELFHCLSGMMANPPRRYLKTGYTDTRPLPRQRTELATLAFSQAPRRPGRFVYSNMSYIVMGAAIDRLSGTSFEEALTTRVLRPLGIESAGYGPPPEIWGHGPRLLLGDVALFKGRPADPADVKSDNPAVLSSAGTLHLRAEDWAKLLRLFLKDDDRGVVQSTTIERVLQMPASKAGRIAMGWAPAKLDGVGYGAQGSNLRWAATALMDEARQRIAFAVCNDGRTRVLTQSVPLVHRLLRR